MNRLLVALALALAFAPAANAQQLKLEIHDGVVTLEATAVPARQILAEWARVGGTKVVGGDKVTGAPLTLRLTGVPERKALEIILRNAAGFMAAPRLASSTPGASTYDRIMILATSSAPASTTANGRPVAGGTNGNQPGSSNMANGQMGNAARRVPPRPPNLPQSVADEDADEDATDEDDEAAEAAVAQPVFTFPAPTGPNGNPVFVPVPNNNPAFGRPGQPGGPVITLQPGANGQPTIYNFVPNMDGSVPQTTPAPSPFGVIGTPSPGMIVQPAQPVQPPQPQRPPPR